MTSRGRFIVVEGGEGAGKTTQARLLAERLGALCTREPGGTALGERLRALVLDRSLGSLDARAELFVMVAARAQHVAEVIRPAIAAGRDVVCDRFAGSTLAYQGFGRGLPLAEVEAACTLGAGGLVPDLVVLLELATALADARRHGGGDRIEDESEEFHARVTAGFSAQAEADPKRWVVVDATGAVREVAGRVAAAVAERLR